MNIAPLLEMSDHEKAIIIQVAENKHNAVKGANPQTIEDTFSDFYITEYILPYLSEDAVYQIITEMEKKGLLVKDVGEENIRISLTEKGFDAYTVLCKLREISTTELEQQVIKNIAHSEYNEVNGDNPITSDETITWYYPEYLAKGMKEEQVKGVVSSLVKKGFVVVDEDDEDNRIYLTDEGVVLYHETMKETRKIALGSLERKMLGNIGLASLTFKGSEYVRPKFSDAIAIPYNIGDLASGMGDHKFVPVAIGSLVEKELLLIDDKDDDRLIQLTEKGISLYQELFKSQGIDENTRHFINGVFMGVHTGHLDEDGFWEIISECRLDKAEVEKVILPYTDKTIREHLDG